MSSQPHGLCEKPVKVDGFISFIPKRNGPKLNMENIRQQKLHLLGDLDLIDLGSSRFHVLQQQT